MMGRAAWMPMLVAFVAAEARAETLRVPAAFATIQAAIDAAQEGDKVIVANGVYTGQGNVDLNFKGKAITVRGAGGAANCVIDCNATEQNPHRGFIFQSGETAASVVEGFTIRNGATEAGAIDDRFNGAGILVTNGSSPTIRDMVITGANAGCWGGALCCSHQSSPTIINCTFMDNYSNDDGGAIFAWNGSKPTIINALIVGNTARVTGGGITFFDQGASVINSTIVGNSAPWGAGVLDSSAQTSIANSIIRGNTGNQQIWGNANVTYSNVEGGFVGAGNIDADAQFVDAPNGDYRLQTGSTSIDAGNNGAVAAGATLDLGGLPRFVDNPKTPDTGAGAAPIVDMGAHENQDINTCTNKEKIASARCRGDVLVVKLKGGMSGDAFQVELSEGKVQNGTLNKKGAGKARFGNLTSGQGAAMADWGCGATDSEAYSCQ